LYLQQVLKHFFLELSVEQIDIMTEGYVMTFLEFVNKNQLNDRNSFKNIKTEAERDKASRVEMVPAIEQSQLGSTPSKRESEE
jgi:hypothetical protein